MRRDKYNFIYKAYTTKVFEWLGYAFRKSYLGQLAALFAKSVLAYLFTFSSKNPSRQQIHWQIYFTGFEAIPLISLVAVITGTAVVLQAITLMPKVGFGSFFGNILVVVIVRELGPLMTAFLVAGRTGAGLATYIGNMKVRSEVDALESMGIDPVRFLVMPAMVGGVASLIGLTLFFNVMAIGAGFLFTKVVVLIWSLNMNLDWRLFKDSIFAAMSITDLVMMILKPLAFGSIISVVAAYNGLKLNNDIRQVPQAASSSVVQSFSLIVMSDLILSSIYIADYLRQIQNIM